MNNKKYIMIGAPIISKEFFRQVLRPLNNYSFIPNGGFWASEYINEYDISQWYKYLQYAQEIANVKDTTQSVIFTLKDNSKILTIETYNDILELSQKYPSYHHTLGYISDIDDKTISFDFEILSQNYDGIYVDYNKLSNERKTRIFDDWAVNTLLLFNLDCIKEYKKAPITHLYGYTYIKEENISEKMHVEEESQEHKVLSEISYTIYKELINKYNNYNFEDYTEYFKAIIEEAKKVIELMLEQESSTIKNIQENLQKQGMTITTNRIITNIVYNNITNYLINDNQRIKTLTKAKSKPLIWY